MAQVPAADVHGGRDGGQLVRAVPADDTGRAAAAVRASAKASEPRPTDVAPRGRWRPPFQHPADDLTPGIAARHRAQLGPRRQAHGALRAPLKPQRKFSRGSGGPGQASSAASSVGCPVPGEA